MSQRLTLALVSAMALIAVAFASGFYLYTAAEIERNFTQKADETQSYLDGTLAPLLWGLDHETVAWVVKTVLQDKMIVHISVKDGNGKVIASDGVGSTEDTVSRTLSIHFKETYVGEVELVFSRAALTETLNNILLVSLSAWLLTAVCISVLTHLFIRQFFRGPLISFTDLTESYRQNPESPPLNATPFVEFLPIENVVKNLANDVFLKLRELEKYRDHLEELVNERTLELRRAITEVEKAKQEALDATKVKSKFLATMSHEIRTPMTGVIGMVDMLAQTKLEDDQRQMMHTLRDSAYALLTIINDILDFSKIEAGKLELETIPLSTCDILEGVVETLAPNANKKGIKIYVHVDPDIPDAVLGDKVRIRQILLNLVGNAVKFTEKGRVLIRASLVPPKDKKTATVRFEIIDSGIGISKEAQSELFKEFSQAESSTTRRFGGTGLGLSICQRLTEMMKGKLDVESELGKGSTFTVMLTLPIAGEHSIKSDGVDLSGLKILFVEDDAEMRELNAKILRHWGAEVTTIGNMGKAKSLALEAVGQGTLVDIIVLGSAWPLETRLAEIEAMQAKKVLDGTRFVLFTEARTKAERKDVENTVYIESDPLRRASFIRGIAVAAGRASPDTTPDGEIIVETVKALSVEEAEAAGTLILVAEDNPTNRDVIGRQLKLLGYTAEFRDDGKQALEAWRSKPYAMLLTDCHMPEMDGFELTKTIRNTEKGGGHRLPILAITASVLKAEVDRCFESGMDDFLAKPLEFPKLKAALKKWMPAVPEGALESGSESEVPIPEAVDSGDGPIDPQALKSVFGDDDDTFKEILGDFVESTNAIVKEINDAYEARDAQAIGAAGHKLKSSSRSVGANTLADLCANLEKTGKAGDWDAIDEAMPRLEPALHKVMDYIEAL